LYGHDLNENITPVEASLTWLLSKRRKEAGGFPGFSVIQSQLKSPSTLAQKRVGLKVLSGAPAREDTDILDPATGNKIGKVTSGSPSPILKYAIAMAYVPASYSKEGTKLQALVRGKKGDVEVVKMPFVPTKYFKP